MSIQRIPSLSRETATGKSRELLNAVHGNVGRVPNLAAVMANSPVTLQTYLAMGQAKQEGLLPVVLQEQIALTVAQENGCEYCLSAHTAIGGMNKMSESVILDARIAKADDPKSQAALSFARHIVRERANVNDADVANLRAAGWSDGEIVEIVFNVVSNIFTNYINHVAGTVVDFPAAPALEKDAELA